MGVGLGYVRCVRRDWCTEVTEARRCDNAKVVANEIGDIGKTLIIPASRTMNGQESGSSAFVGVLDWPGRRSRHLCPATNPLFGACDIIIVSAGNLNDQSSNGDQCSD